MRQAVSPRRPELEPRLTAGVEPKPDRGSLVCRVDPSNRPVESTSRNIESTLRDIQASEAKTRLPQILDEVERGQTVRITRHGRPIARIVPEFDRRQAEVDPVITNLQALRSRIACTSVDELLAWRHEGHRY